MSVALITAVILAVTVAAALFASSFLQLNLAMSDFKNAENTFVYLADILNSISTEVNGSGTVKMESDFFGPSILNSSGGYSYNLNLTVRDLQGNTLLTPDDLPSLRNITFLVCKTKITGVSTTKYVYGDGSILVNESRPLIQVMVGQREGAFIRLDAFRVQAVTRGVIEEADLGEKWGYVTIYLVNLSRGQTNASSPTFYTRGWVRELVSNKYSLPVQAINVSAMLYKKEVKGQGLVVLGEEWEVFDFSSENVDGVVLTVVVSKVELTIM